MTGQLDLLLDPDVKTVLEFMQTRIPTEKLIGVASGVSAIAGTLWGQYAQKSVIAMMLVHPPISGTQSIASE
jgi:hypothetical protein